MADYVGTKAVEEPAVGEAEMASGWSRGVASVKGVGFGRWLLYAVIVILGGSLGFLAHALLQSDDRGEASVLVAPLIGNPYSPTSSSLENMDTEARLVTADAVFVDAAAALEDSVLAEDLAGVTKARVISGSQVINVVVEGPSESVAQERAEAVVEAFLGQRQARAEATLAQQSSSIKLAILAAQQNLDRAVQDVNLSAAGTSERQLARQALNVASATLASRTDELSALGAVSIVPGQIIAASSTSAASPAWPWVVVGVATGILLVLILHAFVFPGRRSLGG